MWFYRQLQQPGIVRRCALFTRSTAANAFVPSYAVRPCFCASCASFKKRTDLENHRGLRCCDKAEAQRGPHPKGSTNYSHGGLSALGSSSMHISPARKAMLLWRGKGRSSNACSPQGGVVVVQAHQPGHKMRAYPSRVAERPVSSPPSRTRGRGRYRR